MVEVSRSGAVRRTIFCRNVRQSTARIIVNMGFCKTFLRSVLSIVYRPPGIITDRSRKYRLRIDCLEMCRFAGLSPRYW